MTGERYERYPEFSSRKKITEKKEIEPNSDRFIVYADSSPLVCGYTLPMLREIIGTKGKVFAAETFDTLSQLALSGKNGNQVDFLLLDSTFENWHDYSSLYTKPKSLFSYRSVSDAIRQKGYRGQILGLFGYEQEDIGDGWFTKDIRRILTRTELEHHPQRLLRALNIE